MFTKVRQVRAFESIIQPAKILPFTGSILVIGQRKKIVTPLIYSLVDLGGHAALLHNLGKTFGNFHDRIMS